MVPRLLSPYRTAEVFLAAAIAAISINCASHKAGRSSGVEISRTEPLSLIIDMSIEGEVLGRRLTNPIGLAVARDGRVYLADNGNDRVVMLDSALTPKREIGGRGREFSQLSSPEYLALDNDLNLAVSEAGNRRVSIFDRHLNFGRVIDYFDQSEDNGFGTPSGVAFAQYGEIWVADNERSRIARFDSFGTFEDHVGDFGATGGQLSSPGKILFVDREKLLACDSGNRQLKFYDKYGNYITRFDSGALRAPVGACVDDGWFWVVDNETGMLFLFDDGGRTKLMLGPDLIGSDQPLSFPSDIALLKDGRLIISDSGNDRLLICRIEYENR